MARKCLSFVCLFFAFSGTALAVQETPVQQALAPVTTYVHDLKSLSFGVSSYAISDVQQDRKCVSQIRIPDNFHYASDGLPLYGRVSVRSTMKNIYQEEDEAYTISLSYPFYLKAEKAYAKMKFSDPVLQQFAWAEATQIHVLSQLLYYPIDPCGFYKHWLKTGFSASHMPNIFPGRSKSYVSHAIALEALAHIKILSGVQALVQDGATEQQTTTLYDFPFSGPPGYTLAAGNA